MYGEKYINFASPCTGEAFVWTLYNGSFLIGCFCSSLFQGGDPNAEAEDLHCLFKLFHGGIRGRDTQVLILGVVLIREG